MIVSEQNCQILQKPYEKDENMDEKKDGSKTLEMKPGSKVDTLKRAFSNLKNCKAKTSIKKVGRSRTQKGQKNY